MFNIAGDGTVQALYPVSADPRTITTPDDRCQVQVGERSGPIRWSPCPSVQRLGKLEEALKKQTGVGPPWRR